MKTSALTIAACAAAISNTYAFTTTSPSLSITRAVASQSTTSSLNMFSGGALDIEEEEDDEKRTQMEQYAKAMGMSVEEYQLGMNARVRMETAINDLRVIGGDAANGVTVERDGNMPPRHLVVTVTDEGKAKGKEAMEKLIVDALKSAADKSTVGRNEAQKDMMKYISDSMKKMGMNG
jgi:DNA-binding protein YbaB